jgi:hypothetical protein
MTASFFWLLIEGVHLYILVRLSIVSQNRKYLYVYFAFGWLASWISVVFWVFAKLYSNENRGCWEIYVDQFYAWIIRGPILVSIVVSILNYYKKMEILFVFSGI